MALSSLSLLFPFLPLALGLASQQLQSPHHRDALLAREDYIDTVCSPNITSTSTTVVVPPCIEVTAIEEACAPNGTSDVYYAAHAECMCGGSYFDDWAGCQACLLYHGERTERDEAFYLSVVDVASSSLCGFLGGGGAAAPTTDFAAIFSAVAATLAQPTTGATVKSDQAPSSTAVSLYFTPSASQGPGAITGSVATATATASATAQDSSETGSASGSGSAVTTGSKTSTSASSDTASSGGASSSSSEAGGAQPTKAAGGMLLGLAGLAVVVGL